MKKLLPLALLLLSSTAFATNWYVDTVNGGTRYSATNLTGQCNGKASTAYVSGVNQPCPFNDARDLWNDPTAYNDSTWVIQGGDIVTFLNVGEGHTTRIAGALADTSDHCFGIGDYCTPPPVPSGTAMQNTVFRGINYAACHTTDSHGVRIADPTKTSHVWGGSPDGAGYLFLLSTSQYVTIQCLDLTDHAACNRTSISCAGQDWAGAGINTGGILPAVNGHNTLTDLKVHGFQSRGMIGNLANDWTLTGVEFFANSQAGLDLDPGSAQDSNNAVVDLEDVRIWFSGCTEQYPIVNAIPLVPGGCTDQNTPTYGGYGDGIGTPGAFGILSFTINHSYLAYNTQDGSDLGHMLSGAVIYTNNYFEGNMGGNLKAGNITNLTEYNNFSLSDCRRMADPITGAPSGYNSNLSLWCRSGDQNSFDYNSTLGHTLTADIEFNTFVGYGATVMDAQCDGGSAHCTPGSDYTFVFKNNTILGYIDPNYNAAQAPGMWNNLLPTTENHNLFYGLRSCPANGSDIDPTCATSPTFPSQPASPISSESALDNFNFYPGSPMIHVGLYNASVPTDIFRVTRPNPPTVGAAEPAGTPVAFPPVFTPNGGTFSSSTTLNIDAPNLGGIECWNTTGSPATNGASGCTTGTLYTGPLTVSSSATYYAVAGGSGFIDSSVSVSNPFVITSTAATPTFAPTAPYTGVATTVTLSSATSGVTFCSTIDGSTPTATSGTCTHGATGATVSIASTATLKSIASKSGLTNSGVASGLFTITPPVVPSGTVTGSGTITGTVNIQ